MRANNLTSRTAQEELVKHVCHSSFLDGVICYTYYLNVREIGVCTAHTFIKSKGPEPVRFGETGELETRPATVLDIKNCSGPII